MKEYIKKPLATGCPMCQIFEIYSLISSEIRRLLMKLAQIWSVYSERYILYLGNYTTPVNYFFVGDPETNEAKLRL